MSRDQIKLKITTRAGQSFTYTMTAAVLWQTITTMSDLANTNMAFLLSDLGIW